MRTSIVDWPTRNLQISTERGPTSTLRLDCHKRHKMAAGQGARAACRLAFAANSFATTTSDSFATTSNRGIQRGDSYCYAYCTGAE